MDKSEDRHEDRRPTLKTAALSVLLGFAALFGLSSTTAVVGYLLTTHTFWAPWPWRTTIVLTVTLLIGVGAILGLLRLKPWKGSGEPLSPTTRRTRSLIRLMNMVAVPGTLALYFGTISTDHPFAMFSNSPVPLWIAIVAITSWLLARLLREWWHYNTDEHEQRAIDFGRRVGAGVFLAVTPAWWVAARGGLLPQPNAMVIWVVIMAIITISWSWHRYR